MSQINYPHTTLGSIQIVHGSDGRLNVTSRSDARAYYISRDQGQLYSWYFVDAAGDAAEHPAYLQNTHTTKDLVISEVIISAVQAGVFQVVPATGTATGGATVTAVNLNLASSNDAVSNALGTGDIGGFVAGTAIITERVLAASEIDHKFDDGLRLGQNDAIAVFTKVLAAQSIIDVTIIGYYE